MAADILIISLIASYCIFLIYKARKNAKEGKAPGLESIQNKYLDGRAVLNCGEATAGEIDEEVMKMLKSAYAEAKKLLSENREALDKIAEFLIEKETITGKEFMKIFREVKGISEPEEGAVSGIEERGRIAMK